MTSTEAKQWKRRALVAKEELAKIREMRAFDKEQEMKDARENAVLRVALREIQGVSNWAYGMVAEKLS